MTHMTSVNLSISTDCKEKLISFAEERTILEMQRITISQIIREAISDYIKIQGAKK